MKKVLTALMALVMILSLVTCSFAEDESTVGAVITFETEDTVQGIDVPEIPAGTLSADVFGFDSNQVYAVYSAPDVKSIRGAGGKSKVSTNDWVQVFGREGDWLLVQYDVKDSFYRIGYISAKAIPSGMSVPDLSLTNDAVVTMESVKVTDDPLGNQNTLVEIPADSHVTRLGTMGDWSYIEGTSEDKLYRGFVLSSTLSDTMVVYSVEEAKRVLEGDWNVYAGDAGSADHLRFDNSGNIYGRLSEDTAEWSGQWAIYKYDASQKAYWNDPEFELTIYRDTGTFTYGLRICWEPYGTNGASYALILSEEGRNSGLVLCK